MSEYPPDASLQLEGMASEGEASTKKGMFSQVVNANPFAAQYRTVAKCAAAKTPKHKPLRLGSKEELDRAYEAKEQVICTPGLSLIKCIIRYVELLHILKPCTGLILEHVKELYEYYIYCVFLLFTPLKNQQRLLQKYPLEEPIDFDKISAMHRVQTSWAVLRKFLFKVHDDLKRECHQTAEEKVKALLAPKLNAKVKLDDIHTLNGVFEKIIAIESCYYALSVLTKMNTDIVVCYFITIELFENRE